MLRLVGGLRIDLDPAAPHRRRQRIGHLLQPRQVRERSVEERLRRVRQEVERILRRRRRRTAARRTSRVARFAAGSRRRRARVARRLPRRQFPTSRPASARSPRRPSPRRVERRLEHLVVASATAGRAASSACCATSSSTSGVARVWCSGFIAGAATLATATIEPDSGSASTHDSRNE